MSRPELSLRVLTSTDLPAYAEIAARAFLVEPDHTMVADLGHSSEPGRSLGVFDGGELIGATSSFGRRITLPGGADSPIACVTFVVVAPGHRRRGVMTSLMRAQLHGLHERGEEPVAALWASEAGIYHRFGYGVAGTRLDLVVRGPAPFRPDVVVSAEPVRELPLEQALPRLREIRDRAVAGRTGHLNRDEAGWRRVLLDPPEHRGGRSALRFAVHPDGYAVFRVRKGWGDHGADGAVDVAELAADGPAAYAAIWRYLLDIDLVRRVSAAGDPDEPVLHLLADRRAALCTVTDGLWVRLVDVDRALAARRYSAPVDVVLDVRDVFCPWNEGRWRLRAGETGAATVTRTSDPADLGLDVTDLASIHLGGVGLASLAAAGRVRVDDPEQLRRTALAFADVLGPAKTENF